MNTLLLVLWSLSRLAELTAFGSFLWCSVAILRNDGLWRGLLCFACFPYGFYCALTHGERLRVRHVARTWMFAVLAWFPVTLAWFVLWRAGQ